MINSLCICHMYILFGSQFHTTNTVALDTVERYSLSQYSELILNFYREKFIYLLITFYSPPTKQDNGKICYIHEICIKKMFQNIYENSARIMYSPTRID